VTAIADYEGYVQWKRWTKTFTYTREEALYFRGETRGLRVAGGDILEIGFGAGAFLAWARDNGARVAGIELIDKMCEAARAQGVELLPLDFEACCPENAGRFDAILAFDVFEHLTLDTVRAKLAACDAMLKPGGHLLLRFPNGQSPFGLVSQNGDPTHRTALSRAIIQQLMAGTRLEVVRYGPSYRIVGGNLPKAAIRLARYAARSAVSLCLNFVYAQNIPWDAVVTLVLQRRAGSSMKDGR
jgi:2-polyprenyl-3-methyl-5-hydroxy-6-metoxy-1,4-benzoquinol methylase